MKDQLVNHAVLSQKGARKFLDDAGQVQKNLPREGRQLIVSIPMSNEYAIVELAKLPSNQPVYIQQPDGKLKHVDAAARFYRVRYFQGSKSASIAPVMSMPVEAPERESLAA